MTPFAKKIYSIVSKIPEGKTLTYVQVARAAGKPMAFRAVGNILNKNRDPKVPCHRVIRSDGSVGGYRTGTVEKRAMLIKEKAILPS